MSKPSAQHVLSPSPTDAISSLAFSPSSTRLVVASWDSNLYIYTRQHDADAPFALLRQVDVHAPILSACWGRDDNTIFAATLDGSVVPITISEDDGEAALQPALSTHEQPANKIAYSTDHDIVLSTSWDGTLHVHSPASNDFFRIRLAAKPFALSLSTERAVVAMAERKVSVYDLGALAQLVTQTGSTSQGQDVLALQPWQDRVSNLKFMARAVACHPDGTGFATSSIEGRVSVEYFDADRDEEKYAFKCHRQVSTLPPPAEGEGGEGQKVDVVYPVNALAFHPTFGTFATGGGDGGVAIWHASTKRRVRQYKDLGAGVAALDFSRDGAFLAAGVCPGFEDGMEEEDVQPEEVKVVVRVLAEGEAKGKAKAGKE